MRLLARWRAWRDRRADLARRRWLERIGEHPEHRPAPADASDIEDALRRQGIDTGEDPRKEGP